MKIDKASSIASSVASDHTRSVADRPDLMTLPEVATYLRVPEATVRYWRHRGEGPPGFRVGKGVRFRRSVVVAWVDEREAGERPLVGAR